MIVMLTITTALVTEKKQVTTDEYKLKAVFLYNFARFVEWPADVFTEAQAPLVIGVLGNDPFGRFLDETVNGEKINDRPLLTNRFEKVSDIGTCHILFISKSVRENHETILSALKGKKILTVSDVNEFTKAGGMIRFVNEDNRIKLFINLDAAKAEDLTISSKLLRIAKIVESPK